MKKSLLITLIATTAGLLSCTKTLDSENDKSEIKKVLRIYERALNNSSTNAIVPLYSKNGIFMPEHSPSQIGTKNLKNAYEGFFKSIKLNIKFEIHEVEVVGDTAWARTSSSGKTKILASNKFIQEAHNEIFIFKKINSSWKIHRYIFTSTVPRNN